MCPTVSKLSDPDVYMLSVAVKSTTSVVTAIKERGGSAMDVMAAPCKFLDSLPAVSFSIGFPLPYRADLVRKSETRYMNCSLNPVITRSCGPNPVRA